MDTPEITVRGFRFEPLDLNHGMQRDDPGAEPPPANLEQEAQTPIRDPLMETIATLGENYRAEINKSARLVQAFNEQLIAACHVLRNLQQAFMFLKPEDIRVGNILVQDLHEQITELRIAMTTFVIEAKAKVVS